MSDLSISLPATLRPTASPLLLGATIPVRFSFSNTNEKPVTFRTFAATAIPPELGRLYSLDTYNLSVLIAHSIVTVRVASSLGEQVVGCGPAPWVNPLFATVTLAPGEAFSLDFDLTELFKIDRADRYTAHARFSESEVSAEAAAEIVVLCQQASTP